MKIPLSIQFYFQFSKKLFSTTNYQWFYTNSNILVWFVGKLQVEKDSSFEESGGKIYHGSKMLIHSVFCSTPINQYLYLTILIILEMMIHYRLCFAKRFASDYESWTKKLRLLCCFFFLFFFILLKLFIVASSIHKMIFFLLIIPLYVDVNSWYSLIFRMYVTCYLGYFGAIKREN